MMKPIPITIKGHKFVKIIN